MFIHMSNIKKEIHSARNEDYEIAVYKVDETGEYRVFVSKEGDAVGGVYTASDEAVKDLNLLEGHDLVEEIIKIAKDDIDRNEFKQF